MSHLGVDFPPDFSHSANRHNKADFCARWMNAFGGDQRNAEQVWLFAVQDNERRDLSIPIDEVFPNKRKT
jgi:hypothetical protein